jgi:phosphohistidine phosphatase
MLTLHLIRHAEAESVYNSGSDFSRKLTPNGISQAQQLGRTLANLSINLGEVACSGATRTRQTAQQLIEQMGQINICYVDELYAS